MTPTPRVATLCLLTLLLAWVFGSVPAQSGPDRVQSYEPGWLNPVLDHADRRVTVPGLENSDVDGWSLPEDWVTIEAPEGMRAVSVRARPEKLRLVSDPALSVADAPGEPAPWAEIVDGGYLRGRRLDHIRVRPVQWRTGGGALQVVEQMRLEFEFAPDSDQPTRTRVVAWEAEDSFDRAVQRLTGSQDTPPRSGRLKPHSNGGVAFSPRFSPSVDGSPVRFLIITTDDMAAEYQRLADWKTTTGMPTVVRTLSWIEANYPQGLDQPEDIRNFIRRAVDLWGVEFVLLGGDSEHLRPRYAKTYFYGGEDIPSDLYFSCLDNSWNADGDNLFAEGYLNSFIPGDGADFYPDVWVGRVPLGTVAGVSGWVDKTIAYESSAPLGSAFGSSVLSLSEMLFPQNWSQGEPVTFDGATVSETAMALLPGHITPYKMYENYLAFPGSVPETKATVIDEFNSGYNMILHVGHGFTNTMAVGDGGMALVNADADAFTNAQQGLLYAINCTSSAFDFDCIAEHMLRNPNGGVVSSVGSVRLDWPATGWLYQDEFFELVYQLGVTRLGEAAGSQKLPFVPSSSRDGEHRWTQFSQVYFGDPTLDLYTGPIDTFSVSVFPPLELGVTSYQITVTDGGGPVSGATVCINKPGDAYGVAVTNASGVATVPFSADLVGVATVAVRGHNHRTRVDSVQVAAPLAPHLYVASLIIDDTLVGNGNGALEAGETARITPVVANHGGSLATGVSATLTGLGAPLASPDTLASVPDLDPDSSGVALDSWDLVIDPSTPDLSAISVGVRLAASGYTRTEDLLLYVGGANLTHLRTTVRDTVGNGNGNGSIEANEDQALLVEISNLGAGTARSVSAVLSSSDPAVQILDGNANYGNLAAGSVSVGDGFSFRFTNTNPHLFTLTLSDASGILWVKSLDLVPAVKPSGLVGVGSSSFIQLKWTKSASPDLRGYRVYRGPSASGPFAEVTQTVTPRIAAYTDEMLPPFTRYFYAISSVDSSGNESGLSSIAAATTSLPAQLGFPHAVGASTASSPAVAYTDADSLAEVFTGGSEVYAFQADGSELADGDANAQTFGVITNSSAGPFWSPPALGDVDGDGSMDIVAVGFSTGQLFVWDSDGTPKPGWPKNINPAGLTNPLAWGGAALADVDGDNDLEIFINSTFYTFAFHHDGAELIDGDSNPATIGVFRVMGSAYNYSTPAISDVDNDLVPEIIVASRDGKLYVMNPDGTDLPGFPFVAGGEMTNSPAVGDLNNDGLKEIIFASSNYLVRAMNVFGAQPPGWPTGANMNQDFDASPALADLDGDSYLDVVLPAGNGTVYAWHGQNGALFPGWGFVLRDPAGVQIALQSSPAIGNLDADSEYEICFGANDGNLYAFNVDATPVEGFPIATQNSIAGGPLLWDIDRDGFTEVVAHGLDEQLYVWKSPGAFDPNNQPWPMFHRNSARTGNMSDQIAPILGVGDLNSGRAVLGLAHAQPNPFAASTRIEFRIPDGGDESAELAVFNVAGRRVRTLVSGVLSPGSHVVQWDGRSDQGQRVRAGVYFYRLQVGGDSRAQKLVLLP